MPDYHGTPGVDNLDQTALRLADGTTIYGDGGNDTITVDNGTAIGGAGNDILIGRSPYSTVAYFFSSGGVTVNLTTGIASDGLGGTDTLSGFQTVQGSAWDDTLIGSAANETFVGGRGSNNITGGGGYDTAVYYFQPSTNATVTYNATTDTFRIVKGFSDGDTGTDILTGIEEVKFSGTGSDYVSYLRGSFTGDFRQQPAAAALNLGYFPLHVHSITTGDFNGDGKADIAIVVQDGLGASLQPTHIFTGDGAGNFVNSTSSIFAGGSFMNKIGGGRTYVADLNNDGFSDIFQLNYGLDDGSKDSDRNAIALSNAATHKLENTSVALTSTAAQNHAGVVADFTGDGFSDVVIATIDKTVRYLTNDGRGGFLETTALLPSSILAAKASTFDSAGAADINGDGKLDLILGSVELAAKTPSYVLLNPGNGNFANVTPIALPGSGVPGEQILDTKSIDLNGDGLVDLIRSITSGPYNTPDFYTTPYIQFLINDGGGQFRDVTQSALPQSKLASPGNTNWYTKLTAVDFNRDGLSDILATNDSPNVINPSRVLINDGKGAFSIDQVFVGIPVALDANSDGMVDIATVTFGGGLTINLNSMTNQHIYKAEFGESRLNGSAGDDAMSDRGGDTAFDGAAGTDTITGGSGNDAINGGSGVDTAVFSGNRAGYAISQTGIGVFSIAGPDGTDTLTNVEYASFNDQKLRLLPGSGTVVDFGTQPATYMGSVRDFDGNNLTGQGTQVITPSTGKLVAGAAWDGVSGWTMAGTADVSGSGSSAHILFNNLIGRWAEVGTETDGKTYFNNYGWAGDTRIVGIYTDPEVALGHAVQGGPNDSQRRFQNDLFIGNLKAVQAAGDYNHDGFQEVYFSLTDGTAYLHALMWNDGNVQYANYQSAQQVQDYFGANGVSSSVFSSWLHEEPMQVFTTAGAMAPPLLGQAGTTLASVAI